MPKFQVINGTPAPDTPAARVRKRARAADKPASLIDCHRCASREVMEVKVGMVLKNGRPSGGQRTYLCAACHRKGERVVLA